MAEDIIFSQIPAKELFTLIKQAIIEVMDSRPISNSPTKANEKPITQKELCAYLNITEPTVLRWRTKGKIPFFLVGTAVRFNLSEVLESLAKNN